MKNIITFLIKNNCQTKKHVTRKRKIMKKSELIKNALIQIYSALDCIETGDDENNAIWTSKLIRIKTKYRIAVSDADVELIDEYLSFPKFDLAIC
jgi:hypothetical protein